MKQKWQEGQKVFLEQGKDYNVVIPDGMYYLMLEPCFLSDDSLSFIYPMAIYVPLSGWYVVKFRERHCTPFSVADEVIRGKIQEVIDMLSDLKSESEGGEDVGLFSSETIEELTELVDMLGVLGVEDLYLQTANEKKKYVWKERLKRNIL